MSQPARARSSSRCSVRKGIRIQSCPDEQVMYQPFLMVLPCINKLPHPRPASRRNSFIRYAVEQGRHRCSCRRGRSRHQPEAHVHLGGYLGDRVITAIHVVQEISGVKQINALGFCVGGTLIANALAVMYARGEQPVTSLTM